MQPRFLLPAALALIALAAPARALAGSDHVPGELIVKYREGTSAAAAAALRRDTDTRTERRLPGGSQQLAIEDGGTVGTAVHELRQDPNVEYAVPNLRARAASFPNDPDYHLQWNFNSPFGIDAPGAWTLARAAGAPGARGATVAVLDSGVAYERRGRYRRAPDLSAKTFVKPYDFIDDDAHPDDDFGHGTHVAGTIASATNNGRGVAGIAYGAKLMPLRVLDSQGYGDSAAIARAIRYATRNHADVINLSLEFDMDVRAAEIPDVIRAIRFAHSHGVVVVAAAGNTYDPVQVAYPARSSPVIAVGATTVNGCQAEYSNQGRGLDVMAPGGGVDQSSDDPADAANCNHTGGKPIVQQTYVHGVQKFGFPRNYEGTSMATPHVSSIAALIIATGVLGRHPSPAAVEARIEQTARDLGAPGYDSRYGWGLVNAAAALQPAVVATKKVVKRRHPRP
ncbi:MAG TPA: S8 family serine peptidase [Thermoleophilaceae bacterium]